MQCWRKRKPVDCRRFAMLLVVALGSALLVFSSFSVEAAPAKGPIKLGVIGPFTGPLAALGPETVRGLEYYFDGVKWTVAGRKIVPIQEDTEAKPGVGVAKTRELIEEDKVKAIIGYTSSGVAYAVRDLINERKVPTIITAAASRSLTQEDRSPYIFRTSDAGGQEAYPLAKWVVRKLGYKKFILMGSDYAAGHEMLDAFAKGLKEAGGKIIDRIFPPLGTSDFSPYLARIQGERADALFAFFAGSDAIRFVKQYKEVGLKGKLPLVAQGALTVGTLLPSMGEAALGIITARHSSPHFEPSLEKKGTKEFIRGYSAKFGEPFTSLAFQSYTAARAFADALKAVHGDIEDQPKFLEALRRVRFETPMGLFRFDENQQVIFNVYIRKVQKVDGRYTNVAFDVIHNVHQPIIK